MLGLEICAGGAEVLDERLLDVELGTEPGGGVDDAEGAGTGVEEEVVGIGAGAVSVFAGT